MVPVPTVEVALTDGRRMVVQFGRLASGRWRKWADSPRAALAAGPTDAKPEGDPVPDPS